MEKYGEIPPRFTKAWWEYFWEYYKWHVLGTLLAVILVFVWVYQCTHKPKYDLTMVYASHQMRSEAEQVKISTLAEEYIIDADGNGKNQVVFQPLIFSDGAGSEEFDNAIQTKLDLTFLDDYNFIYLMDEIEARLYMNRNDVAGMFDDVSTYLPNTTAKSLQGENGVTYAVSLADSKLLKDNKIDSNDLYLMIKVNGKDDEINKKSHDSAVRLAKALVN